MIKFETQNSFVVKSSLLVPGELGSQLWGLLDPGMASALKEKHTHSSQKRAAKENWGTAKKASIQAIAKH